MADIKPELNFGLDDFGKQKKLTTAQSVAQMLVNLLLLKPGQIPSLPHIGIDIKQYLYKFEDEINSTFIKNQISTQCNALLPYIDLNNMQFILFPYKDESILYLFVPLSVLIDDAAISIGFKRNNNTSLVTFNYKINNTLDVA